MKEILTLHESIEKISNAKDVFKQIKYININYAQENFLVFALDSRLNIISVEVLFKGGISQCPYDPKTIFRYALLKNASALIIAHNHPSGALSPSVEDNKGFKKIKKIGNELTMPLLDSIIFNKTEFFSLNSHL